MTATGACTPVATEVTELEDAKASAESCRRHRWAHSKPACEQKAPPSILEAVSTLLPAFVCCVSHHCKQVVTVTVSVQQWLEQVWCA